VIEAEEKVKVVQENLRAAQARQKSYFNKRRKPHLPEAFNASELKANYLHVISGHMRSLKNVDQWRIDCDFLRNSPPSMMFSMYLSSRSASAFQQRLLTNRRSLWNQTSLIPKNLLKF